ncbi:Uncharacterised protein [uncultured archaeon]|nr:Uncharacterised protein [uncultured archaeon]
MAARRRTPCSTRLISSMALSRVLTALLMAPCSSEVLVLATKSNSSMSRMQGLSLLARSKTLSMFLEVSPRYWLVIMESLTSTIGKENQLDNARAVEVLPVPGGPTKSSLPIS